MLARESPTSALFSNYQLPFTNFYFPTADTLKNNITLRKNNSMNLFQTTKGGDKHV